MTYIDDIKTARDNAAALMAAGAHDDQTTYSVDGRSFDWLGYNKYLEEKVERLTNLLARLQPQEVRSIALG